MHLNKRSGWAFCVLLLAGCASGVQQSLISARHIPSGLNRTFTYTNQSFAQYEQSTRQMIANARIDLGFPSDEQVIVGNAPFDLRPAEHCGKGIQRAYHRGVLLIHGLGGSPYHMRHLGEFFQKNCFRVMAILLPGNGTRPGDLTDVKWQEWVRAVAYGVDVLAYEADDIYLAGFSIGGTLGIRQGVDDARVKGLFLFAPAVSLTPFAGLLEVTQASWLPNTAPWLEIMNDSDVYKYESFPTNAVYQLHLLIKEMDTAIAKKGMPLPMFMVATQEDATLDTSSMIAFFDKATHPANRLLLYAAEPIPPKPRVEHFASALPQQRILNISHVGLTISPSDPHYGAEGSYVNCAHYFKGGGESYRLCKERKEDYLGEKSKKGVNEDKGVIRRLTYNPHYDGMLKRMEAYISSLP